MDPFVRRHFPEGLTLRTMTPELISQRDDFVRRAHAGDVKVTRHGDFVMFWEEVVDGKEDGEEDGEQGKGAGEGAGEGVGRADAKRNAAMDEPAAQDTKRPKHASST